MTTASRLFGSAALSLSLAAAAFAQTPALDVKMGLWEISSVTNLGGDMPAIDLSQVPPEQRAQMEAMIKGMMGQHTNVTKTCMTREKFDQSTFMMPDEAGSDCKQTIVTNTSRTLDATVVCTGERAMTGKMHMDALSQTAMKADIKMDATEQGRAMNISMTMTGRWLGEDCGDVD
jgi:hypothetical protein